MTSGGPPRAGRARARPSPHPQDGEDRGPEQGIPGRRRFGVVSSTDPDGDALSFRWLFYPEAGSGIPGHPVATYMGALFGGNWRFGESSGPPTVVPRVELENAETSMVAVTPRVPGIAHVVLIVEDDGSPSLTAYRRAVLEIAPAGQ